MKKGETIQLIKNTGIIGIMRGMKPKKICNVSKALVEGGINVLEVTMDSESPLVMIKEIKKNLSYLNITIGAGTVLDAASARSAIIAGADFIVAPTLNINVIKMCRRYNKVVVPGVMTPTEIISAWEAGADMVKVFPASTVGPDYIKSVKGPLGQVDIVPTGGVNKENARNFLEAGAIALGIGSALINYQDVDNDNYKSTKINAKMFRKIINDYKTN